MRIRSFIAATGVAVALAFTFGSISTYAQQAKTASVKIEQPTPAASGTFAALKGVKAEPMAAPELAKVKGLDIHFTTPSNNAGHPHVAGTTGWHFVNHTKNNLGNGQASAIAGPGYSGLCGAALMSGALTIPGQNPTTGIGGGC